MVEDKNRVENVIGGNDVIVEDYGFMSEKEVKEWKMVVMDLEEGRDVKKITKVINGCERGVYASLSDGSLVICQNKERERF